MFFVPPIAQGRICIAVALLAGAAVAGAQTLQAPGEAEASLEFTVQKSEKLIRLSRDLLQKPSDWGEVARFNKMNDLNLIFPGQKLRVPLRLLKREPAAARIVSAEGDVILGGQRAVAGVALAEGSRLATGANSSAVIELGDGSRVKFLPNTSAAVEVNRNYLMRGENTHWFSGVMRMASGTVETVAAKLAGRATPFLIITPTGFIGVRGTQFRVGYEGGASSASRAEVTEGLVRADNPAQSSNAELPGGTGALVDPAQREIRVVKLLPAPDLSGLPAQLNKPAAALPMPTLAGADAFRVQIASDAAFDKIVRDLKVTTASIDLGTLEVGSWNLRMRGIDPQGIEGFDSSRVVAIAAPVLRARLTESWLRNQSGRTEMQVLFDSAPTGPVTAVMSADPAMSQPLRQGALNGALWDLGTLPAGTYFVQFRVPQANGIVITEVQRFTLPEGWGNTVMDSFNPLHPAGR